MTTVPKSTKSPEPKQTQDGRPGGDELDEKQLDKATGGSSGAGAGKITFNPFSITRSNG